MLHLLNVAEGVIADRGYRHDRCFYNVGGFENYCGSIRAGHKVVNRRLKTFSVLRNVFRCTLYFHSSSVHAVSNVTQLLIEHEIPLSNLPDPS